MKNGIAINLLSLLFVLTLAVRLEADWKADWEKTVEGAKKEGRLNLYVGRYGQTPLLEEFKKEYPQINVVTVNGTGDQLATRIVAEVRAGKTIADIYSGGPNSNFNFLYRGKILDSIKSAFMLPEVRDESKWYGGNICSRTVRANSSSFTSPSPARGACPSIPILSTRKNLSRTGI